MVKGPFTTMSKFITGAFKLNAVMFRCLTLRGIQSPEVGSLSAIWQVLRAKVRISLGGVLPGGSQREALGAKGSVILSQAGFLTSNYTETQNGSCPAAAISVPEKSRCVR